MRPEEMNDRGVEQLMIAMYVLAGNDLISAYRYKKEDQARAIEKWLKEDTYGFIADYGGIIRAVKKKAKGKGWVRISQKSISSRNPEPIMKSRTRRHGQRSNRGNRWIGSSLPS